MPCFHLRRGVVAACLAFAFIVLASEAVQAGRREESPSIKGQGLTSPTSQRNVLLLGRAMIRWDNFRGRNGTDYTGFKVVIEAKNKSTGITRSLTAEPDRLGYVAVENAKRGVSYSYKELQGPGWKIPVPFKASQALPDSGSRVMDMGQITLIVNSKGNILGEMQTPGVKMTQKPGGGMRMSFADSDPIHKYFLNNFPLRGWHALVQAEYDEALAARAERQAENAKSKRVRDIMDQARDLERKDDWNGAIKKYKEAQRIDSGNKKAAKALAEAMRKAGKAKDAVEFLKKEIGAKPSNLGSHTELIDLYRKEKNWPEAAKALLEAAAKFTDDRSLRTLSWKARDIGAKLSSHEARTAFLSAYLKHDPRNIDIALTLAKAHIKSRQYNKAMAVYQGIRPASDKEVRHLSGMAEVYSKTGDAKKAAELCLKALTVKPGDWSSARLYRDLAMKNPDPAKRVDMLSRLVSLAPATAANHIALAKAFGAAGNNLKAEAALRTGLAAVKNKDDMIVALVSHLLGVGRYDQATAQAQKSLTANPATFFKNPKLFRAAFLAVGKRAESIRFAENAFRKNDKLYGNAWRVKQLAEEYLFAGQTGAADALFRKAMELKPDKDNLPTYQADLCKKYKMPDKAEDVLKKAASKFPDKPNVHEALGKLYLEQGRHAEALQAFDRAIELKSGKTINGLLTSAIKAAKGKGDRAEAIALITRGAAADPGFFSYSGSTFRDILREAGLGDLALKFAREALEKNPKNYKSYWPKRLLAEEYIERGQPDKALEVHQTAIRLYPDDAWSRIYLADELMKQERTNQALRILNGGLDKNPENTTLLSKLSAAYMKQGRKDQALAVWTKALKKSPGNPALHSGLADQYKKPGDTVKAMRARVDAFRLVPDNSWRASQAALACLKAGRDAEALAYYRNAVQLAPVDAYKRKDLARCLDWTGRSAEAETLLKQSLKMIPDSEILNLALAEHHLDAGQPRKALAPAKRAVAIDPEDACNSVMLGRVHMALGDKAKAMAAFETKIRKTLERIDKDPESEGGYNSLAWFYAEQDLELDKALKLAKKSVSIKETSYNTDTLGWVYYKRGQYDQAINSLRRAIELDGTSAGHKYRLAMAQWKKGARKEARKTFGQAQALSRYDSYLKAAKAVIDKK